MCWISAWSSFFLSCSVKYFSFLLSHTRPTPLIAFNCNVTIASLISHERWRGFWKYGLGRLLNINFGSSFCPLEVFHYVLYVKSCQGRLIRDGKDTQAIPTPSFCQFSICKSFVEFHATWVTEYPTDRDLNGKTFRYSAPSYFLLNLKSLELFVPLPYTFLPFFAYPPLLGTLFKS